MDTGTIVTAVSYATGLTLGGIALFIKMTTDAALANQKHKFLEEKVDKLEIEVKEIKEQAFKKLDHMNESIHEIKIDISKILNQNKI